MLMMLNNTPPVLKLFKIVLSLHLLSMKDFLQKLFLLNQVDSPIERKQMDKLQDDELKIIIR